MRTSGSTPSKHASERSPWSPLRQSIFRALWLATIASNIGTWMQNVGASWLMTTLSPSPLIIAMVQAATSLPVFLLALPAGALADVVDRRALILITQVWMLAAAAALSAATYAGAMSPALVFQGGTAMGSLVWGAVAGRWGIRSTLVAAGVGLIAGAASTLGFPLSRGDSLDLRPAADWPEPNISGELDIEKGPTFVTVEYRIDPLNAEEFVRTMADMRRVRRRDGALRWGLFVDATDSGRFLEEFVVESWLEHLRQHERVTVSDRQLQEHIRLLHSAPGVPHVAHYISAGRSVRPSDALRPAPGDPPEGTKE